MEDLLAGTGTEGMGGVLVEDVVDKVGLELVREGSECLDVGAGCEGMLLDSVVAGRDERDGGTFALDPLREGTTAGSCVMAWGTAGKVVDNPEVLVAKGGEAIDDGVPASVTENG